MSNHNRHATFQRRRWIIRIINLLLLTGLILLIIRFWDHMPAWFIVLLVVVDIGIIATGRAWCGYVCPVGFLLDLFWIISKRLHVRSIKRSKKFNRFIPWFKWFFLVFYIILHFVLGIDPGWLLTVLLIVTAPFIVRFWCSFCPVGTLLGLLNRVSVIKITKDADKCVLCASCARTCPMQSKRIAVQRKSGANSSDKCILCAECITHCPKEGALKLEIAGKAVYASGDDRKEQK